MKPPRGAPNSIPSDSSSSPVESATRLQFNSIMEEKSKILIVGATGYLGFHLAQASCNASHPTFALIRDSTFSSPHKLDKLRALSDAGVKFIKVSLLLLFSFLNYGIIVPQSFLAGDADFESF